MNLQIEQRAPRAIFEFECRDAQGNLKWSEKQHNLVTNAAFNWALNVLFGSTAKSAGWHLGILDGTPAATDTMASHSGWTEVTYTSARAALSFAAASGGSAAASTTITFAGSVTFNGAFVVDNSTEGGTTGNLYNATNFSTSRSVGSGDTLACTVTLSMT